MSYLKMALAAMKAATVEGEVGGQRPKFAGQGPIQTPRCEKSPSPPIERILTCADCPYFEANHGPNPRQGWGKCLKRNKGRYGCATACEKVLAPGPKNTSHAHLEN
jgi:hypothetical protein